MKNRMVWTLLGLAFVMISCARVQVEAPKDPIKMDISMRLDVYQHVEKDIDEIENIVRGEADSAKADLSSLIISTAYAADLSPEVEAAAYRRRDRRPEIKDLKSRGILGEDNQAYLVLRSPDDRASQLIGEENSDRKLIYESIAKKNGSSVSDVQKIYAEKLRGWSPSGTPIQDPDGSWKNK